MGTYEDLKAAIQQVIRTNGNNEITGALLQQMLLSIVNSVGANAAFVGNANPSTNPGTPDQNVFYLTTIPGIYANFNNIEILPSEFACLTNYTGVWSKISISLQYPYLTKTSCTTARDVARKMILQVETPNFSFAPSEQMLLLCYFNNDNIVDDVRLSIFGTEEKPVYVNYELASSNNSWQAQRYYMITYTKDLDSYILYPMPIVKQDLGDGLNDLISQRAISTIINQMNDRINNKVEYGLINYDKRPYNNFDSLGMEQGIVNTYTGEDSGVENDNKKGCSSGYIKAYMGDVIMCHPDFEMYVTEFNTNEDKTYIPIEKNYPKLCQVYHIRQYCNVRVTILRKTGKDKWESWNDYADLSLQEIPRDILYVGPDYKVRRVYTNEFLNRRWLRWGGILWSNGQSVQPDGSNESSYYSTSPYLFVSGKTKINIIRSLASGVGVMVYYYDINKIYIGNEDAMIRYESFEIEFTGYIRVALTTQGVIGGNYVLYPENAEYVVVDRFYDIEKSPDEWVNMELPFYDVPIIPAQNSDTDNSINLGNVNSQDIISLYDELIENSNGYITKTILGKDQSGEYDIIKLSLRNSNSKAPVKILIEAQMHGRPYDSITASYTVYSLVKMLTELPNETALYIRQNVDFEIIPIVNPWGVDNMKYGNSRDIQINLNFDVDFVPNVSTTLHGGEPVYSGENAFSEKETQYIRDMILQNLDADFFIDQHSYSTSDLKATYYQKNWKRNNNNLWYGIVKVMENTQKRIANVKNRFIMPTDLDIPGGWSTDYTNLLFGIPGLTVESSATDGGEIYGSNCLTSNLMNLVGLIMIITKQKLKNIQKYDMQVYEDKFYKDFITE